MSVFVQLSSGWSSQYALSVGLPRMLPSFSAFLEAKRSLDVSLQRARQRAKIVDRKREVKVQNEGT